MIVQCHVNLGVEISVISDFEYFPKCDTSSIKDGIYIDVARNLNAG